MAASKKVATRFTKTEAKALIKEELQELEDVTDAAHLVARIEMNESGCTVAGAIVTLMQYVDTILERIDRRFEDGRSA